ncbi:hypothetical protein [Catellatospora sp. NPDC049609]|uniref:hypothetical protein n=1 Tax=Catellatospora sp. NPDC049609 TaxID=3155505 RepID=UPI0034267D1F
MELRRRRRWALVAGALCLSVSMFARALSDTATTTERLVRLATVGLLLVLAVGFVRPGRFRFRIGDDGLTLRLGGVQRSLAWPEIDTVILDQPPPDFTAGGNRSPSARLLVVAAAGVRLDRTLVHARSPVDGRPCRRLLDLGDVKETADEIAAALARAGGTRFVDDRARLRAAFTAPRFAVVPRGYDQAHVDGIINRGRSALGSTAWSERREIAQLLLPPHPSAVHGYDRAQVDDFTSRLSAAVATLPGASARDSSSPPGAMREAQAG